MITGPREWIISAGGQRMALRHCPRGDLSTLFLLRSRRTNEVEWNQPVTLRCQPKMWWIRWPFKNGITVVRLYQLKPRQQYLQPKSMASPGPSRRSFLLLTSFPSDFVLVQIVFLIESNHGCLNQ